MITYKLNEDGSYAQKIVDSVETGEWCNTHNNEEYLDWIAQGNQPLPANE